MLRAAGEVWLVIIAQALSRVSTTLNALSGNWKVNERNCSFKLTNSFRTEDVTSIKQQYSPAITCNAC